MRSLIRAGVVGVLAAVALVTCEPALADAQAPAGGCAGTIVVAVEGTGQVGKSDTVVSRHVDQVAGAQVRWIDYPGSIFPDGPLVYDESVRIGIDNTRAELDSIAGDCPDSAVELIGHSQGARVVGDVLAELVEDGVDTAGYSALLLSDPRAPGGVETSVEGLLPGYTMTGPRGDMGAAVVESRCAPRDPVCDWPDAGDVARFLLILPEYVTVHTNYPVR